MDDMDKVMQELIDGQREIAKVKGYPITATDEQIAAYLMDRYGHCPSCGVPIDFKPREAVTQCERREHFIHLYGMALVKHYQDHPHCREKLWAEIDDSVWRKYINRRLKQIKREDIDRWEGR